MDPEMTMAAGEMPILFQALAVLGRKMKNAWFIIHPTPNNILQIFETFKGIQSPIEQEGYRSYLLGISSAFVGSFLYAIGGQVPNDFVLSDCIRWLDTRNLSDTRNQSKGWETGNLPSPCVDSVIGIYGDSLYILPDVYKYGYYDMDEDTYYTKQEGYIWNTRDNKCLETRILPPTIEGGKRQWRKIRACAALGERGLLIAMDGENNTNFYLHPEPENQERDWQEFGGNPLPRFMGETSFAASNGRLYILEVPSSYPAWLYIYNTNEKKLVTKQSMDDLMSTVDLRSMDELRSLDEWDRVVRLVPVADDRLCFLWLGPFENGNGWPPVKNLHYLKVNFSINANPAVEIVDYRVFSANITDLLDCLPCSKSFSDEVAKGKSPLSSLHAQCADQLLKLRARAPVKNELVMEEKSILCQTVVPSSEGQVEMNAWFKIQPTLEICGPLYGRIPCCLGITSAFVGSSLLYTIGGQVPTIGGQVPKDTLPRPLISWLDTHNAFNGWEDGELPSPCVDSVISVYLDSLYILTEPEGYIWNTKDNKLLQTRIRPPIVEGGERQWRRIRACAALDGKGLLIAMDGENNTNFYLHSDPQNPERDWDEFDGSPLPSFMGVTSFAASKGRLYILEFPNDPPASLYIYDTNVGNLVIDRQPIPELGELWTMHKNESDRVVRLVPVADDRLCFLWLGPEFPVKTLHNLKVRFSTNPNPVVEVLVNRGCPRTTKITHLLNCLPCDPEQVGAQVEPLPSA